jgi:hypothetical protein
MAKNKSLSRHDSYLPQDEIGSQSGDNEEEVPVRVQFPSVDIHPAAELFGLEIPFCKWPKQTAIHHQAGWISARQRHFHYKSSGRRTRLANELRCSTIH